MTGPLDALDTRVLADLGESVGGDQEFMSELIDEFLDDARTQLKSLREGAASGDAERARRAAHTLKGNCRTFGAVELASLCQETEAAAGLDDLAAVLARVDEIDGAWARVRAQLLALRERA
jgi:HPt (histidine-containing phosphotransfer) domain-containing protein